jgi:hypothetical protein
MRRPSNLVYIGICLALFVASCSQAGPGPQAWLDKPIDLSHFPVEPIEILAHASSAEGVSLLAFSIDGDPIGEAAVGGGRLERASITWSPPGDGIYLVGVRATDGQGRQGTEAVSRILVGDVSLVPHELGSPIGYGECDAVQFFYAAAQPSLIVPGACTVLHWEIAAEPDWPVYVDGHRVEASGELPLCPEETEYVEISVETPQGVCRNWRAVQVSELAFEMGGEPEGELELAFVAEPQVIPAGECSMLFWEVSPAGEYPVMLNDEPVEPSGEREVCPPETTTWVLAALDPGGPKEVAQTVTVLEGEETPAVGNPTSTVQPSATQAPDTTAPVIGTPTKDRDWCNKACCGGDTSFYFTVNITDNVSSGHDISVMLYWTGINVRSGPEAMHWSGSGSTYFKYLGLFNNPGSLSSFSITATDKAGNSSTLSVPGWNLQIEDCSCP